MVRRKDGPVTMTGKNHADESETEPATKPKREGGRRTKPRKNEYPSGKQTRNARSKSKDKNLTKKARKLSVKTDVNKEPLLSSKAVSPKSPRRKAKSPGGTRALPSPGNSQPRSGYLPPEAHSQRELDYVSQGDQFQRPSGYTPPQGPSLESSSIDGDKYMANIPSDDVNTTSSSLVPLPVSQQEATLVPNVSAITSHSYSYTDNSGINTKSTTDGEATSADGTTKDEGDIEYIGTSYTREIEEDFTDTPNKSLSSDDDGLWSDDNRYIVYKQKVAGMSIFVSALQLALLFIQLILCGVASLDVNPMIGPFPDAFSEWGGKNAYLLLDGHQYFRLVTPIFLHVGVIHMLVNAFCQLETCAIFEREWGSTKWIIAYLVSGTGAVATSCVVSPDEIGVSSSGALMGLFGAKVAQLVTYTSFELHNKSYMFYVGLDQMGGVLCSAAVIFLLSLVTYIDISGHVGGFLSGYLVGIILFCKAIASTCTRLCWALVGLTGLIGGSFGLGYLLYVETYPDNELGDACQYFRNLYPEGYDCECQWG